MPDAILRFGLDAALRCRTTRPDPTCFPSPHRLRNSNLCFPQILGSFFRRRGVLLEAGSPLEACRLGKPRHELDVPVVMVHGRFLDRSGMNHQVIGWVIEHLVGADQEVLQCLRQSLVNLRRRFPNADSCRLGRIRSVSNGKRGAYGATVRKPGRRQPRAPPTRFPDERYRNRRAALFINVILLRAFEFLDNMLGNDGQRYELTVGMFEGCPGRRPANSL